MAGSTAFWVSILVFIVSYVAIALEKRNRTYIALAGGVVLLITGVLSMDEAIEAVSWETIGLLFGMFIIVEVLSEAGFFAFFAMWVARKLKYNPYKILVAFPLVAGFLSAFLDSITVMLFMVTLTYELSLLLKFHPVPIIVGEVTLANIGGSSTLVGDPPNVILGTLPGINKNFNDFAIHNGPISVLAALGAILYIYLATRKKFVYSQEIDHEALSRMDPRNSVKDAGLMKAGLIAFAAAIFFLVTHAGAEHYPILGVKVMVSQSGKATTHYEEAAPSAKEMTVVACLKKKGDRVRKGKDFFIVVKKSNGETVVSTAPVGGEITKIEVSAGDIIKPGQEIATVNWAVPLTVPLASLIPAFFLLLWIGGKTEHILREHVDFEVLLFFIGLFVIVGGMEKTEVISRLAHGVANLFEGSPRLLLSSLLWGSGGASAIVDNVPFALSMGYVIRDMSQVMSDPALAIMVWAVSLGTDIGGNITPIGASANVVAYRGIEKCRLECGWIQWLKLTIPPTFIALVICNLGVILKYAIKFY